MRPVLRSAALASAVLVGAAVVLAVGLGIAGPAGAAALPVGTVPVSFASVASVTAAADEPATTVPADDAGIGGLDTGSDTPSPRGEPAPPRSQRIADTAIFVGLLVVLVAGVGVAVWSGRRSRPAP